MARARHMTRTLPLLTVAVALLTALPLVVVAPTTRADVAISGYEVPVEPWCEVRDQWIEEILATNEPGRWVPMRFTPSDEQLRKLGLPSAEFLRSHDFSRPTMVLPDGTTEVVELPTVDEYEAQAAANPTVASYAGAGCFGIRPGALLLTITNQAIGWCTMAHVYGSPGNYQISTAGHCGKTGETATVIAAYGNRAGVLAPIIFDFGRYAKSTGDGGVGNDWALIGIDAPWQGLVSPTMCVWGGPTGMYTKTGTTLAVTIPRRGIVPTVTTNPDPYLVQTIVHYGHGTGVGFPAGTPRAAEAIYWGANHFMFSGAISPGDSGSGSNTLGGDSLGATREAAGINTHLYVDPLMRDGIGIMAGTRATKVTATLANGQLVPYPAPVAGAP